MDTPYLHPPTKNYSRICIALNPGTVANSPEITKELGCDTIVIPLQIIKTHDICEIVITHFTIKIKAIGMVVMINLLSPAIRSNCFHIVRPVINIILLDKSFFNYTCNNHCSCSYQQVTAQ